MNRDDRIFLAGHRGMVGSALMRALQREGFKNVVTATRQELDLRDAKSVKLFFERERLDCVLLAAAKAGGIQANRQFPADFIYDNLMIQNNVIHQAYLSRVKQLLFLGSSCIYPRDCPQPMKEEYLMTGPLEPTNEGYALAKIAGVKMAKYYHEQYGLQSICPVPCNLYGQNDSFDPRYSHVVSALVKKFADAVDEQKEEVVLWGSGIALREFLHVDDAANALLLLMEKWHSPEIINIGSGRDISIRDLAETIAQKVHYTGKVVWDITKPDGMLRKRMDVSKLRALGFNPVVKLKEGIDMAINEYRSLNALNTHGPCHTGNPQ
ncbi:GDP-L-fucose synthase [Nitrospiraceae bacterium AH_259_D15_M11_P09]|nr:GDP-L-fucose synthase [Nitrospiraceae bacterium AH_259_D15_M11_P09]